MRVSSSGQPRCGSLIPFEIGKSGDMLSHVYLELDGPVFVITDNSNYRDVDEMKQWKSSYSPYLAIERV